jgi:2-hydroxy-3-keto-5-methylthiopentenyl-1-phosphate phosphatase
MTEKTTGDNASKPVVLCDFDGTAVTVDTGELVLSEFAEGDWKVFDRLYERGRITLEECVRKQFSMVRATESLILKRVEPLLKFRQGFDKLVSQCETSGVQLIIVSAGLDFCIQHFLKLNGWLRTVEVQCLKTVSVNPNKGIIFKRSKAMSADSTNLKDDLVRHYKKLGEKVVYVGDGLTDYTSATLAHHSFVIRGSKLARKCRSEGIACEEIGDFYPVVRLLRKSNRGSSDK